MKFRILLRSFDNELINLASQQLRSTLVKTECKLNGTVALPTKIKRFVYYVHPMLIKTREHFELRLYKRFIDLNTTSQQF
jgi:ribosomal protein S10